MPSLQALSQRLRSVTSTARLTKTMKVVASVKLKVAQRTMEAARPFGASTSVLADVLTPGEEDEAPESKLIVPITSDRGLCGGVNSYIIKDVKKFHAENPENASTLIIGSKGVPGLGRTHAELISTSIDETYTQPVSFSLASFLAEQILASPQQEYTILYNKFRSVINFEPTPIVIKGPEALGASGVLDEFEFEGEKEEVLADMYQFNLATTIYACLLENITCEQASRMTAMDNASNNAGEVISKLTLQYNRQRQAVITTELTEIVAGAESV
jgi:F-type H+-transporting ATPase subunit gamma